MNIKIRNFREEDKNDVQEIFSTYWTDPEFLEELSEELNQYINDKEEDIRNFIIAEREGEIVGIAGYKKIPDYLEKFSKTKKPVELYVIAVKYKRQGIGKELKSKIIEMAKAANFTEILLFSPESHKESWSFHDVFYFERVGKVTPPEDEVGQVWRKVL